MFANIVGDKVNVVVIVGKTIFEKINTFFYLAFKSLKYKKNWLFFS